MSGGNAVSFSAPGCYRIEVEGRLRKDWRGRFGSLHVLSYLPEGGGSATVLQGVIRDQAELAGVLKTLYELHLTLRSVRYLGDIPPP